MTLGNALHEHWSIVVGIMLGVLVLPVVDEEYRRFRDAQEQAAESSQPVVEARGVIVERLPNAVIVQISGRKLRNCRFVGLQAYTIDKDEEQSLAKITRMDETIPSSVTRPVGAFNAGLWRIEPLKDDPVRATVWVTHECRGHSVTSVLATVALNGPG